MFHCLLFFLVFKTTPKVSLTEDETEKLTDRIQNAGTEVVNAKAGSVSILLHFPLDVLAQLDSNTLAKQVPH